MPAPAAGHLAGICKSVVDISASGHLAGYCRLVVGTSALGILQGTKCMSCLHLQGEFYG